MDGQYSMSFDETFTILEVGSKEKGKYDHLTHTDKNFLGPYLLTASAAFPVDSPNKIHDH
jgi:hypothetical protein